MSYDHLAGIRVVELSMYAFAPACAAVLADWGADVIKIVPPGRADPMLGKTVIGGLPDKDVPVAFMWEQLNRGKRCIGLDVSTAEGRQVIDKLLESADVFLTNLLPDARRRFGIDVDRVQALNPRIIYARASGHGPDGPQKDAGGFDHTDFWARTGLAHAASSVAGEFVPQPGPALGDVASGAMLAGAISTALFKRERTGEGGVIDVSLLSAGVWMFAPAIIASQLYDVDTIPRYSHMDQPNPLVTAYKTRDGREIYLAGVQTEKKFRELIALLGVPHLADDPRFETGALRLRNSRECIAELDKAFAARDLAEWLPLFKDCPVPWGLVQTASEAARDVQVAANHFVVDVEGDGATYPLVASPAQFDSRRPSLERAPQHGEHTEAVLMEIGMDWSEIEALKAKSVVN